MGKKFDTQFLENKFKEYYEEHDKTATHIFIFSKKQQQIKFDFPMGELFNKGQVHVGEKPYTEMRHRDSDSTTFGWGDAEFVAVGTYEDVNFK